MSESFKEPSTEGLFEINVKGDITGKQYSGQFKCKILNVKGRAAVAKHFAFLNGDIAKNLDPLILALHEQISFLRYCLVDYPDFWKKSDLGYDLHDENVIREIYNKCIDFEESYLKAVWGEEHVETLKNGR